MPTVDMGIARIPWAAARTSYIPPLFTLELAVDLSGVRSPSFRLELTIETMDWFHGCGVST